MGAVFLQTHAKVQIDFDTGMDSWYRELFGEDWMKKNSFQRRELERQAKENGENTPMRHGMPWHSFRELLLYMFHPHTHTLCIKMLVGNDDDDDDEEEEDEDDQVACVH